MIHVVRQAVDERTQSFRRMSMFRAEDDIEFVVKALQDQLHGDVLAWQARVCRAGLPYALAISPIGLDIRAPPILAT